MREFFSMGGYAWYVWMSYGAVALVFVIEILGARARLRNARVTARQTAAATPPPAARFDPARST